MSNVKKLEFAEGTDVGAPTDLGIQSSTTSINEYPDDAAFVSANGSAEDGDTYLNTTTRKIRYYLNSAWRNAIPESDSADPTKKVEFDLTGATTGTTATFDINNTVSRTYTMQDETGTIPVLPILLTSEVSGALPIANGGTGQTSATAAFDALAPTTTTGDLIYHSGTDNVRLGIGSEGQQLKVTSGVPAWGDAGGGSGEKNYVENPSAASAITGWNQVGDLDVARTTTAAELPREHTTGSGIKITADSNVQSTADYVYYDFNLDDVDLSKKLKIQWSQKVTGTYSAGQLAVVITTQADRTTALHTPITTAIPAMDGEFITSFDAGTTATLSLVIRATTDMTTDGGIVISDVVVGPGIITQGAVVSEWQSWTPTGAHNTNVTYTGRYRRVGDSMEIVAYVAYSGAPNSASWTLNLPSGHTIDTSKNALGANTLNRAHYGTAIGINDGNTVDLGAVIASGSGTSLSIAGPTAAYTQWNQAVTTSFSFGSGDAVHLRATVPIAEWAGSGTVNVAQNNVEYVYSTATGTAANSTYTGTGYGPQGVLFNSINSSTATTATAYEIEVPYALQDGDEWKIEIKASSTSNWVELGSVFAGAVKAYLNGTYYVGMDCVKKAGSNNTLVVYFGNGGSKPNESASFNVAGAAWSTLSTAYWRVKIKRGGAAVGFGLATSTSAGLLPPVTSMSDALATQLGYKQYLHGTSYNGGNAPTVAGTGASIVRGVFIPYQTQDGTWRLRFNYVVTLSTATRTSYTTTINGVTFKNVASYLQSVSVNSPAGTALNAYQGFTLPNTSTIEAYHASFSTGGYGFSGDVELESKPTWAY